MLYLCKESLDARVTIERDTAYYAFKFSTVPNVPLTVIVYLNCRAYGRKQLTIRVTSFRSSLQNYMYVSNFSAATWRQVKCAKVRHMRHVGERRQVIHLKWGCH